jgi:hypothetical protein
VGIEAAAREAGRHRLKPTATSAQHRERWCAPSTHACTSAPNVVRASVLVQPGMMQQLTTAVCACRSALALTTVPPWLRRDRLQHEVSGEDIRNIIDISDMQTYQLRQQWAGRQAACRSQPPRQTAARCSSLSAGISIRSDGKLCFGLPTIATEAGPVPLRFAVQAGQALSPIAVIAPADETSWKQ